MHRLSRVVGSRSAAATILVVVAAAAGLSSCAPLSPAGRAAADDVARITADIRTQADAGNLDPAALLTLADAQRRLLADLEDRRPWEQAAYALGALLAGLVGYPLARGFRLRFSPPPSPPSRR